MKTWSLGRNNDTNADLTSAHRPQARPRQQQDPGGLWIGVLPVVCEQRLGTGNLATSELAS